MDAPYDAATVAAIRLLKARYCRFLDLKQWDEWGELFLPDAVMIVKDDVPPELGEPTIRGRAAIVAQVRRIVHSSISVHQVHEPEITVSSASTAAGIWPMADVLTWPAGVATPAPFRSMQGFGYYYEQYLCVAGRWFIASLELRRLRVIAS
jgi:SnoaL-like domain